MAMKGCDHGLGVLLEDTPLNMTKVLALKEKYKQQKQFVGVVLWKREEYSLVHIGLHRRQASLRH